MSAMASQTTGVSIVCWHFYSGVDQRKYESSAALAFARGIHRWPVAQRASNAKMLPFDDVIMNDPGFPGSHEQIKNWGREKVVADLQATILN